MRSLVLCAAVGLGAVGLPFGATQAQARASVPSPACGAYPSGQSGAHQGPGCLCFPVSESLAPQYPSGSGPSGRGSPDLYSPGRSYSRPRHYAQGAPYHPEATSYAPTCCGPDGS